MHKSSWPYFGYLLFRNLLVGTSENHETSRDKLSQKRDVNPEPAKHEFSRRKAAIGK
jgi:hypothetical protein